MPSNESIPPNFITAIVGAFVFFIWLREKTKELYETKKRKEWIQKCKEAKKPIKEIEWMVGSQVVDGNLSSIYAQLLGVDRMRDISIEKVKNAANYKLMVLKDEGNEEKILEELIIAARNYCYDRIDYWFALN